MIKGTVGHWDIGTKEQRSKGAKEQRNKAKRGLVALLEVATLLF